MKCGVLQGIHARLLLSEDSELLLISSIKVVQDDASPFKLLDAQCKVCGSRHAVSTAQQ